LDVQGLGKLANSSVQQTEKRKTTTGENFCQGTGKYIDWPTDRELNTSMSKCFYSCYYKDKQQISGKYNVLHLVLLSSYKETMGATLGFLT